MKPFFLNWDYRDLRRLAFTTLATLLCVMYMLGTPPSPRLSASASAIAQSIATYGVQGIIPWSKWTGPKGSEEAWWTYTYDANGNLTTGTQTNGKETFARYQYTWDVKNRLSRFVENETQRQRNGYEFESGLRYLKEDIRFTKQAPMFETVKQRTLYSDAGEEALRRNRNPADRIGRKKSAPRRRALSGM